ncbi:C-C motif chemokine 27a isoform X2 [Pangasianodon hypophthalmus]|uniref:C-C motif chemokine 27a isoform X2 n=1 Tax=Pangasianodon hypophthalmus TaxID=310915 RepID=UPI002307C25A|nr:C-C motif chemokine 27a isoform X2 [Pangasianodon hypophthalmus]
MERRTAAVLLLLLCAIIFITAEGRIPSCCVGTTDKINQHILKKAQKYAIQSDAGPCELKALVLYVGMKKFCLDPKTEKKVKHMLRKKHRHAQKQQKQ